MELIYFTVAGIVLYLVSDRIVDFIEVRRGERLPNRSILFFFIIFTLSVISFNVIQYLNRGDESLESTTDKTVSPAAPATSADSSSGQ